MQHKSLIGLAIFGLVSTAFLVYSTILLNDSVNKATNSNKAGSERVYLYVIGVTVAVNILINTYFLLARNRHTVALILKILLMLELLNLLGVATGMNGSKALSFVIDGGYAIYIFIVLNVIRAPQPM